MKYGFLGILILLPSVTLAQNGSIQGVISGTLGLINDILIPFVLGIAFLLFIVNVIRFFVVGGSNDEGKENAKSLALYSIGAFVFILAFWGLINIIASGIGLNGEPCAADKTSDYIISPLAPCSTPTPRSRPTGSTIPTGGPGTFQPSSNAPANPFPTPPPPTPPTPPSVPQ